MPVIDVTTFTGMRPAVAGHLLEQNEAHFPGEGGL